MEIIKNYWNTNNCSISIYTDNEAYKILLNLDGLDFDERNKIKNELEDFVSSNEDIDEIVEYCEENNISFNIIS